MTALTTITEALWDGVSRYAEIADLSDKHWHVRVRDGMPFEVRRWGCGVDCVAMGGAHHFSTLDAANQAAARWVGEGL
ncbi:hypothetical protein [uncultured Novosphingobium sp.]|uniref:hypothetical protein n=1 Tax=uncultured Novosphingobium sp. TaxID=292277 RepID=UPI00374A7D52